MKGKRKETEGVCDLWCETGMYKEGGEGGSGATQTEEEEEERMYSDHRDESPVRWNDKIT